MFDSFPIQNGDFPWQLKQVPSASPALSASSDPKQVLVTLEFRGDMIHPTDFEYRKTIGKA